MGLFDFFKKKANTKTSIPDNSGVKEFERTLIQEVALTMFNLKITKQPALSFFKDDMGIFDGVYVRHITAPQYVMMEKQEFNTYLMVLGCHALGAAVHVALCQSRFDKPVEEFGKTELQLIELDFLNTDPYELAIKGLGYSLDGNNKRCLDHIVVTANTTAIKLVGNKMKEKEYQKAYMKVLYNAGVTLIYGR